MTEPPSGIGRVEAIAIAEMASAPMRSVEAVDAIAGVGLDGDRYATGAGHWSPMRRAGDVVTLIEGEVVDEVAARHGIGPLDTRRNITTRDVRLSELIGSIFRVGEIRCRAVRLCEPCSYLDGLLGTAMLDDLVHRGGIRAEILTSGRIAVGDRVERVDR